MLPVRQDWSRPPRFAAFTTSTTFGPLKRRAALGGHPLRSGARSTSSSCSRPSPPSSRPWSTSTARRWLTGRSAKSSGARRRTACLTTLGALHGSATSPRPGLVPVQVP